MITNFILEKYPQLRIIAECVNPKFGMINSGSVEIEVGEFIYSIIRMIKPMFVLETGTYHGVSSSYIAMALKLNGFGKMVTIDPIIYENKAVEMWQKLDVIDFIEFKQMSSMDYIPNKPINILFLDSEPHLRFDEFIRFFDNVVDGGIIIIHDLPPNLCYNETKIPINGMNHWPYGDFREKLGPYMKDYRIQTFSFPTSRGLTIFQKCDVDFSSTKFLKGII